MGLKTRRRSHDSNHTRQLLHHQPSANSLGSALDQNISAGVDCGGGNFTQARYKDSYNQGWAIPDFDKGIVTPPTPTFLGNAQRAQVPFDHIDSLEK